MNLLEMVRRAPKEAMLAVPCGERERSIGRLLIQKLLQLGQMMRREGARFDLIAIEPIAALQRLNRVTQDGQSSSLPLAKDMEVFV
jgi:hypothetical protein